MIWWALLTVEIRCDTRTVVRSAIILVSSPRIDRISDEIRSRVTRGSDIALRRVKLVKRGWLIKTSSGKIARNANRERYLNEFMED